MVLDAGMPGMDGLGVARSVRENADLPGLAVVLLTDAGRRLEDEGALKELGVHRCLTKPVKHSDLLKAVRDALGAAPASEAASASAEGHVAPAHPLRILLAEDNAVNQKLAVRLLEKQGHSVTIVGNGREALAALEAGEFDAVLMDVSMPEMDGLEATAQVRRSEAERGGRRLPIIAMTAHAMKGDRERCLEAGMDGYVSKPIRPDELARALADAAPADHPAAQAAGSDAPVACWPTSAATNRSCAKWLRSFWRTHRATCKTCARRWRPATPAARGWPPTHSRAR